MGNKSELTLKNYKKLFDSLYPQLCVFAYDYLNDLKISKDVVQGVFLEVWEDKIIFKNEDHAKSFFYEAVKNKCLNHPKNKLRKA